jgi:rare lipoprotein A
VYYRRSVLFIIIAVLSFTPLLAQERGKASYYSRRATGARTSSGSSVHHDSLTCAHRTYPFGTLLKVTNLSNNHFVIVKVTDRGPYGRRRIVDLSYRAANELGMLSQGVATVMVEVYQEAGVPYRNDDLTLPAIVFEVKDSGVTVVPEWRKYDTKKLKINKIIRHTGK